MVVAKKTSAQIVYLYSPIDVFKVIEFY